MASFFRINKLILVILCSLYITRSLEGIINHENQMTIIDGINEYKKIDYSRASQSTSIDSPSEKNGFILGTFSCFVTIKR